MDAGACSSPARRCSRSRRWLCALADSRSLLIGARALQGIGGAVISPASLAIIATSFAEGRERSRALGVWGAMGGLGGSLGVLLGGILTQAFSWPAIFLVNVPIAIGVIVCSRGLIPEGRRESAARHFDASGALLVTGGLTALVYGIVRTDTLGWGSTGVIVPLLLGAVLLATFVFVEGKVAQEPLMPLRVFTMARLRAANLIMFLLYAAVFAIWFFLSLYLQQVLHYDPLQTGVRFLPMTLAIMATSTLAPRLVARFGERLVLTVGMLVAATGLFLLTGVHSGGSYLADVLPGGLLAGLGLGLSLVPATIAAVAGVPARAERARFGHAQHLASDRRRARPRRAQHDRRVTHACGSAARCLRSVGAQQRLPSGIRRVGRAQPAGRARRGGAAARASAGAGARFGCAAFPATGCARGGLSRGPAGSPRTPRTMTRPRRHTRPGP